MKKARIILILITIMGAINSYGQEKEKIIYIFPDDVEVALNSYIKTINNKDEYEIFLTLYNRCPDRYYIYVNYYKLSDSSYINTPNVKWVELSNRYGIINNELYPILLGYDYDFSTSKPESIGEYGNREGQILKSSSLNDGFFISFSKSGIVFE